MPGAAATSRSSRSPASAGVTSMQKRFSGSGETSGTPLSLRLCKQTVGQQEDACYDERIRQIERGPELKMQEVCDTAIDGAVDEIAGAARNQQRHGPVQPRVVPHSHRRARQNQDNRGADHEDER